MDAFFFFLVLCMGIIGVEGLVYFLVVVERRIEGKVFRGRDI